MCLAVRGTACSVPARVACRASLLLRRIHTSCPQPPTSSGLSSRSSERQGAAGVVLASAAGAAAASVAVQQASWMPCWLVG